MTIYDDFISVYKDKTKTSKEKILPHLCTKVEFYEKISE